MVLNNQQCWYVIRPNQTWPNSWSCRIHWLHRCSRVKPFNACPGYDTKKSDGEFPIMLELWGMWGTTSLPSFSGRLWPGVVAPDRDLSMGLIGPISVLMRNWIVWNKIVWYFVLHLNCVLILNWIVWTGTIFDWV